jgi:hypothetical protein
MKITGKKVAGWIGMTLGVVGGVALGGLFINGNTLVLPVLKWLPEIVHTVVGYLFVGGSLLSGALAIFSKK